MAGLVKRGKTWHLRMRIPKRFAEVEPRKEAHRSLETDSLRRAQELLPAIKAGIIAELEDRLTVRQGGGEVLAAQAAARVAMARGFTYRPVADIARGSLGDLLARVEAVEPQDGVEVAQALLGGVEAPTVMLSDLVDEVERFATHENRFKNENQMRLWRNPRKRAVANLIAALGGDRDVREVDHAAALQHKVWWTKRINVEGQSIETANKDFANMAGMLRRFYESIGQPNPPEPYRKVFIKDRHKQDERKLEIPVEWIVEKWFAPGALDSLNAEARDILLISIETGCRQSEIYDLPASAFVLDHAIPHLSIKLEEGDDRREVKNPAAVRLVPLVGVALAAARRNPNGFPRYRGKSSYSAAINKTLRSHGLLPTDRHTVGGVRHTWESRMVQHKLRNEKRGAMMGHSIKRVISREVYGDDLSLKKKLKIAQMIALPVPDHLL